MCHSCEVHRSQDSPTGELTAENSAEMLRARFAAQAVFDDFGALPYPEAIWAMQMMDYLLYYDGDEANNDKAVSERLVEAGDDNRRWLVRKFPEFGNAELISVHEPDSAPIVIDFAFTKSDRARSSARFFEAKYRPHLCRI